MLGRGVRIRLSGFILARGETSSPRPTHVERTQRASNGRLVDRRLAIVPEPFALEQELAWAKTMAFWRGSDL